MMQCSVVHADQGTTDVWQPTPVPVPLPHIHPPCIMALRLPLLGTYVLRWRAPGWSRSSSGSANHSWGGGQTGRRGGEQQHDNTKALGVLLKWLQQSHAVQHT
jgi:hypothetical protein